MAIVKVQDSGKQIGDNVGSDTFSFVSLPQIGNHVFVQLAAWSPAGGFSGGVYSDNQSNSWVRDIMSASSGSGRAAIASAKVANSSGTFTVTATLPAGSFCVWSASEFSGIDPTSHLDKTGDSGAGTSSPCTVTAGGANAQADELVLAALTVTSNLSNASIQTPASIGYSSLGVEQDALNHQGGEFSFRIVSAGETSSASWTHGTASGRSAAIATYKASTAPVNTTRLLNKAPRPAIFKPGAVRGGH